jgi:hypothetical protein
MKGDAKNRVTFLALARIFACEVWNFYAERFVRRKFFLEVNEYEEGALSTIYMRLALG